MADDWLEDLADLFEQQSLGTKSSLTDGVFGIFTDGRPKDKQFPLILLSRTGGVPDTEIPELRLYTFQVMVIGDKANPEPAFLRAREVYQKIAHRSLTASGARTFKYFLPLQFPSFVGHDENDNFMYSHNYRTMVLEEVA